LHDFRVPGDRAGDFLQDGELGTATPEIGPMGLWADGLTTDRREDT
jgi:hypothetical protein